MAQQATQMNKDDQTWTTNTGLGNVVHIPKNEKVRKDQED